MFALFDRLMARVRRHYPPARLLYTALLIGIGSLKRLSWEAWALELLTLPLNLLFRPLLLVYLQDRRVYWAQGRPYPGFHVPSRLMLLYWVPAAVTTPAAPHLLASF